MSISFRLIKGGAREIGRFAVRAFRVPDFHASILIEGRSKPESQQVGVSELVHRMAIDVAPTRSSRAA